jgi:hypothetical protein
MHGKRTTDYRLEHVSGLIRACTRTPIEIEHKVIEVRNKLQSTKYAQIEVNAINREPYLRGFSPLIEKMMRVWQQA